jgi:PAS domain-containing protein
MGDGKQIELTPEFKLITQLFDTQPDAVIWFVPKFAEDGSSIPIDFEVGYCNNTLCNVLKVTKHQMLGSSLLNSSVIDEVSRNEVWKQCLEVWTTGKHNESTYFNEGIQKYLYVKRSKFQNGVLSITHDHTKFVKDYQEKEHQSKLINQIIDSSESGISVYEAIRDKTGKILDFKLKLANQRTAEITAFSLDELYKYTARELMVIRGQLSFFDVVSKVVETGGPVYTEYFTQARNKWMAFSIKKFEDGYLLNYFDITRIKNLENKAKEQADMLSGILNASTTGLMTLEAIYSGSGKIEDFKFLLLNSSAEKILGLTEEDKTKTYLSVFPNAKKNGFFDLHVNTLLSGESITKEFFYKGDRYNGWYYISLSKMNDTTLVQSFSDITSTRESSGIKY